MNIYYFSSHSRTYIFKIDGGPQKDYSRYLQYNSPKVLYEFILSLVGILVWYVNLFWLYIFFSRREEDYSPKSWMMEFIFQTFKKNRFSFKCFFAPYINIIIILFYFLLLLNIRNKPFRSYYTIYDIIKYI